MRLSLVLPYYRNPGMLRCQLAVWRDWSADLKAQCEVVIVDDGSPEPAADVACSTDIGMPLAVYRVLEDRPWHQHAARNLGAHVAEGKWLLLTDMDHIVPAETLAEVLRLSDRSGMGAIVYTFARRDAPVGLEWKADDWRAMAPTLNERGELKPHVNSFAMMRALYWRVGGYDETYCGVYGTDKLFRTRLYGTSFPIHLPNHPLIRVPREVIPDASTTTLPRKEGREPFAKKRIRAEKKARGEANVIKTLQFEWERAL